jgi:DnaJ-class molecular chaperone
MAKNYYEILGVSQSADLDEIKLAYRRLASKFHPDKYQGDKKVADEIMKQINVAYNTISDPLNKPRYDDWLRTNSQKSSESSSSQEQKKSEEPKQPKQRKTKSKTESAKYQQKRKTKLKEKSGYRARPIKNYRKESNSKYFGQGMIKEIDKFNEGDKWRLIWILVVIYFLVRISSNS